MAQRKAIVEVCDNPDCDFEYVVEKSAPSPGFHLGKGYWVLAVGGPLPAIYAHSYDCIVPAIEYAINGRFD